MEHRQQRQNHRDTAGNPLPVVDAQAREENLLASATICSDVSTELNGQERTSGCLTA
jgi:hypothetical protein